MAPRLEGALTHANYDPVQLIAIHRSKYFKDSDGHLSLGPGPFVGALESASGKVATTVGKPSPSFFEAALESMGCEDKSECVMIGDDLFGDVEGAMSVGVDAVLVR